MSPLRQPRRRRRRPGAGDRGATDALGLALLAPAAIGLALVIVLLGRSVDSRASVHGAAEAAAQAAARERSVPQAIDAARRVGAAALRDHASCTSSTVAVDASAFRPGGLVGVTVTCVVRRTGLEPVAPAGSATTTATAFASIDPHRGAAGAP